MRAGAARSRCRAAANRRNGCAFADPRARRPLERRLLYNRGMKKLLLLACGVLLAVALAEGVLLFRLRTARRLAEPDHLTEAQRAALKDGMGRHGDDMTDLMFAVVLLDHGTAARTADALAASPAVDTGLSKQFATLQAEMKARAAQVAAAATAKDDARLSESYGRLAESCVACHRVYLHDQP